MSGRSACLRQQAEPPRSRVQGGFSLAELVVAMVIVGILLALLTQTLLQAYRLSAAATDAMTRAVTELAEARLRGDVANAVATSNGLLQWSEEALELRLENSVVTYTVEDGHLTRTERQLDTDEPEVRSQRLAPVDSFRWLSTGTPTLWVEWRDAEAPGASVVAGTGVNTRVEQGLFQNRRQPKLLFLTSRRQATRSW